MNSEKNGGTEVDRWVRGLIDVHACIARYFERAEPRQHALAYLTGKFSKPLPVGSLPKGHDQKTYP